MSSGGFFDASYDRAVVGQFDHSSFALLLTHIRYVGILQRSRIFRFQFFSPGATQNHAMKRFLNRSLPGSYAKGAGGVLDLFGTRAPVVKPGTLEDDFRSVYRDFQEVGKDFASVLSKEVPTGGSGSGPE